MKKLLLAGVMLVAASAAHADWQTMFPLPKVPLPREMMGEWCFNDTANDNLLRSGQYNVFYYFRNCSENDEKLFIRPDCYDEVWDNCPFTNVEKEMNGGYLIYTYCEYLSEGDGSGRGVYFSKHFEYYMDGDQLVVRKIPEL
jgi:hypothetical protein